MRNFLIVLKYTMLENARKKTFMVTNVILVLLTVLLFNINNIADAFSNNDIDNGQQPIGDLQKIVIVDDKNVYENYLNNFQIPETNYVFVSDNDESIDDLKDKVMDDELSALVIIDQTLSVPTFKYIVKDDGSALNADAVSSIIKSTYINLALEKYDVDQNTIVNINSPVTYEIEQTNGENGNLSLYVISIFASLILYLAIYFYGYSVSTSVSSEKTSRVMETLVTSTKPSSIVLGKTAAMGILGLAQLLLLIITSYISYKLFVGSEFIVFGEALDLSIITLPMILLVVLYFTLGYCLYAMLNAVAGSTVSKAEDLYSASMPISFISLASFYLGYFSLMNPASSINVFASLMPFSSAFTMPSRMMVMSVPIWQIILSIVLLIATISLLAVLSVKLYSAAILHYGSKLSVKDLFKMSKNN